jgi:hypothetical protein
MPSLTRVILTRPSSSAAANAHCRLRDLDAQIRRSALSAYEAHTRGSRKSGSAEADTVRAPFSPAERPHSSGHDPPQGKTGQRKEREGRHLVTHHQPSPPTVGQVERPGAGSTNRPTCLGVCRQRIRECSHTRAHTWRTAVCRDVSPATVDPHSSSAAAACGKMIKESTLSTRGATEHGTSSSTAMRKRGQIR